MKNGVANDKEEGIMSQGISIKDWRALPRAEQQRRIKASKDADAALHANSEREKRAGIRDETPEYLRLNGLANDKADRLPWYRK